MFPVLWNVLSNVPLFLVSSVFPYSIGGTGEGMTEPLFFNFFDIFPHSNEYQNNHVGNQKGTSSIFIGSKRKSPNFHTLSIVYYLKSP